MTVQGLCAFGIRGARRRPRWARGRFPARLASVKGALPAPGPQTIFAHTMGMAQPLDGDCHSDAEAKTPGRIPSLSIVLPCWNEGASIEGVIRAAIEAGEALTPDLEILVVDDGSTDDTAARLGALEALLPALRVVRHRVNQGYGAALRSGFRRARGAYVFFTDSDGQFDLRELGRLVEGLDEHDVVVGYRLDRQDGLLRALYGKAWTTFTDALLGTGVRDVNCAFKIFPRALVADEALASEGALVGAELVSEARARGLRIGGVGVRPYPRASGRPTGAQLRVIGRALVELALLVRRRGTTR